MGDFQTIIKINAKVEKVFKAITKELNTWWGANQDVLIDKQGVAFTVSWGVPWYKFEVTKYKENSHMIWKCLDANQKIYGLENVEKEWVGTTIHWTLQENIDHTTTINFKHKGLNPQLICCNFCSKSWTKFLHQNLVEYLEE